MRNCLNNQYTTKPGGTLQTTRRLSSGLLLAMLVMLPLEPVLASMRCADGILANEETIETVLKKCGNPDERTIEPPGVDEYGVLLPNAVRVERWTYGPQNGMYWHLRFIDGRLVESRSRR